MSRIRGLLGVSLALVLAAAAPALGDTIEIISNGDASTEGLGSFSGLITYETDLFSTTGLLTIALENTSDPGNGGYITGFLFNVGSVDPDASASLLDAPEPFMQATGNGLSGVPYGDPYDAGAALGGKFLGGGNPTAGIAVGESSVFSFQIDASDAGDLTAIDFLDAGQFEFDFIVRFRGFDDEGSDKVPAQIIPLPAPIGLGLLGLALVGARQGLRRRP